LQLLDATEDLEAVNDVEALQQDIADLKEKVRVLKEEHHRIKSEATLFPPPLYLTPTFPHKLFFLGIVDFVRGLFFIYS
jgi:hypothetical protein